jgi:hypothetical protein
LQLNNQISIYQRIGERGRKEREARRGRDALVAIKMGLILGDTVLYDVKTWEAW